MLNVPECLVRPVGRQVGSDAPFALAIVWEDEAHALANVGAVAHPAVGLAHPRRRRLGRQLELEHRHLRLEIALEGELSHPALVQRRRKLKHLGARPVAPPARGRS